MPRPTRKTATLQICAESPKLGWLPVVARQNRFELQWNGITIEVCFRPPWFPLYEQLYGYPLAHLEVTSIEPKRAPLPITETGFRSHFMRLDNIQAEGGPVAYVQRWLDYAAQSPKWKRQQAKSVKAPSRPSV
jgi:hypothetical protein